MTKQFRLILSCISLLLAAATPGVAAAGARPPSKQATVSVTQSAYAQWFVPAAGSNSRGTLIRLSVDRYEILGGQQKAHATLRSSTCKQTSAGQGLRCEADSYPMRMSILGFESDPILDEVQVQLRYKNKDYRMTWLGQATPRVYRESQQCPAGQGVEVGTYRDATATGSLPVEHESHDEGGSAWDKAWIGRGVRGGECGT